MLKIAVIGAGNVGGTLGRRWAEIGHDVIYGVSDPLDPKHGSIPVATPKDSIEHADVVVFAVPFSALHGVVQEIGDFGDRVVFDCTNPISEDFSGLSLGNTSAAEELARWSGSDKVVKIFNTVGFNIMENPNFGGTKATMLYCGDDRMAKQVAVQLATELGFGPVDAGPLSQAHWLESLAWLWISMAVKFGHGREFVFEYLKR